MIHKNKEEISKIKKTIFLVFAIVLSSSLYAKPKAPKLPKILGAKDEIVNNPDAERRGIKTSARIKELDEVKQSAPKPQEEKKEQPPIASENKKSIQEIKQDLLTYISENNTEKILNAIDMIEKFAANDKEMRLSVLIKNEKWERKKKDMQWYLHYSNTLWRLRLLFKK